MIKQFRNDIKIMETGMSLPGTKMLLFVMDFWIGVKRDATIG